MNRLPLPVQRFWNQLSERDRKVLLFGLAFVLLVLLYSLLSSLISERARLEKSLPELRTDVALFQRDLAQLKGPQLTNKGKPGLVEMQGLLAGSGLPSDAVMLTPSTTGGFTLQGKAVNWASWTRLLEQAELQGFKLVKLAVQASDDPQTVHVETELAP